MLAKLVGYNEVDYSKNGADKSFIVVYVSSDKEVTYGKEYLSAVLSQNYWLDKIYPAFMTDVPVHIGFDKKKNNKPFLYLKS